MNYTFTHGYEALYNATEADSIIAIGYRAAYENTYTDIIALGRETEPKQDGDIVLGNKNAATRLSVRNYLFNADQDTTGLDGYALKFNSGTGEIELQAASSASAMSSFILSGDTGTNTIQDADTAGVYGGANVSTTLAGDSLTITLSGVMTVDAGFGSGDSGALPRHVIDNGFQPSAIVDDGTEITFSRPTILDTWTNATRPTNTAGVIGYNSDEGEMEYGDGVSFQGLSPSSINYWTQSGSDVYYSVGQVAIGTSTMAGALNINGNVGTDFGIGNFIVDVGRDSTVIGDANTFIGDGNFRVSTSGIANTGQGYQNFYNLTTGSYNTGQGYRNFYNLTSGNNNTGQGSINFYNLISGISTV